VPTTFSRRTRVKYNGQTRVIEKSGKEPELKEKGSETLEGKTKKRAEEDPHKGATWE
jgi:hypothetical protein